MARLEGMPRRRRKLVLADLLSTLRPEDVGVVASFTAGEILPAADMERAGITPAIIRTALSQVTRRTEGDLAEAAAAAGGYPELVLQILKEPASSTRVTLDQVRGWIAELLGYSREPLEMTVFLLQTLDPVMNRFLLRILLGELPIGLEIYAVLEAVGMAARIEAETVQQCYELTNNIEDASERAFRGRRALAQVHCRTGRPYRLMPYTPLAAPALAFERAEGPFLAEAEIPGIRLEIHRRHATIQLYTRQLKDVTRAFPELASALERSLGGTDDLILEGQAYFPGLDANAAAHAAQVRLSQLPTQRGAVLKPETLMSLAVLDLTRQGREDLMERPYDERRKRARMLFKPSDRLTLSEATVVSTAQEAEAAFQQATAAGAAALLLKPAQSTYHAGRENVWFRVVTEPGVNLVVVGATLNAGGTVSRVSLACQAEGGLATVGELSSSAADPGVWKTLQTRLPALVALRRGERLTLQPELVVEVTARSIRRSPRRPSGYSLSGINLKLFRGDLGPLEADTSAHLQYLLEAQGEGQEPDGAE